MNATITTSQVPVCTVCIANYNGAEVLDDCLHSVFTQDCEFSFEIIVHDDASTDDSMGIVRERYPTVRIIQSRSNVGFCISNNRMVAEARGQYILLLNNDATLFPDALRTLFAAAQEKIHPAILGLPQYDARTKELVDRGSRADPFLNPIPNLENAQYGIAMVSGACLWIPAVLWERLGGFPEWFGSLAEDMYLCCVARLWGYEVSCVHKSGFLHRQGHSLGGGGKVAAGAPLVTSRKRRILSERNKSFVIVITYPSPIFEGIIILHVLLLFAEGCVLAVIKRDTSILKTIYLATLISLWASRAQLWSARQVIQAQRTQRVGHFFAVFKWIPQKILLLQKHGIPKFH